MIVVDVETTGFDHVKHSILSIGAVDFQNQENYFYRECRLREGAEINPQALEVNGFTLEKINSTEKSCEELIKEFIIWVNNIKDKTLCGQYITFDFLFLKEHFQFYNLEWPFKRRLVDLHSIFIYHLMKNKVNIPDSGTGLDYIINYLGLDKRGKFHNALEDARLTAKAFSLLLKK